MGSTMRPVAWLCILSTLLVGCFGSVLVRPEADEWEKISSHEIEYVITKDGRGYQFDTPPTIVIDTIVGEARLNRDRVSILLSDAALLGEYSGRITYVVTKTGTKYTFEEPPAIVDRAVTGEANFIACGPLEVRIPFSDVREACVAKFSPDERTWLVAIGVAVLLAGVVAFYLWSQNSFAGALG